MTSNLIFASVLIAAVASSALSQKTNLQVSGTIVGEERLFGHIYSRTALQRKILLVRVDSILKAEERSQYILVQRTYRLADYPEPVDLAGNHQWRFKLKREKSCDSSLRSLQFAFFSDNAGQTVGLLPRIRAREQSTAVQLSFSQLLPCYTVAPNGIRQVSSDSDLEKVPDGNTFASPFILDQDLFSNLSGTPVRLSWSVNGGVNATNISDKRITSFTLGCLSVGETPKSFETFEEFPTSLAAQQTQLSPRGSDGTTDDMYSLYTCYKQHAMLAVIAATYEDGTKWRLATR